MTILGIGSDIVNIQRFGKILKRNKLFKSRVFSKKEISNCNKKRLKEACFAKRFAAKEAFLKALGTGLVQGLKFNEITVEKDKLGKPMIKILGRSNKIVSKILKRKRYKVFLSISDENVFAISSSIIVLL